MLKDINYKVELTKWLTLRLRSFSNKKTFVAINQIEEAMAQFRNKVQRYHSGQLCKNKG